MPNEPRWYVGDDVTKNVYFYDADDVLTDPSAAVVTVRPEGGDDEAVSLTTVATGIRQFVYRATYTGKHIYTVTSTVGGLQKVQLYDFFVSSTTPDIDSPAPAASYYTAAQTDDLLDTLLADYAAASDLTTHTGNTSNPHATTAAQVGAYTSGEVDTLLTAKAAAADLATLTTTVATKAASADLTALTLLLPRNYQSRVLAKSPSNLIQYLPLDLTSGTTVTDLSSQGNNGTLPASGITYGQTGIGDGRWAVKFSGSDTYVQVGNAAFGADWNGNSYSMIAWGRVDDATRWADATSFRYLSHIRSTADSTYYTVMGKTTTTNQLTWRRRSGGAIAEVLYTLPTAITDWFCMGITFTLTPTPTMKCYLNGTLVGTSTSAGLTTWAQGVNPPIDGASVLYAGSLTLQEWFGWGAHSAIWAGAVLSDTDMAELGRV